jgi:hypothetical protein
VPELNGGRPGRLEALGQNIVGQSLKAALPQVQHVSHLLVLRGTLVPTLRKVLVYTTSNKENSQNSRPCIFAVVLANMSNACHTREKRYFESGSI